MKQVVKHITIIIALMFSAISTFAQTGSSGFGSSFSNQDVEYILWCDEIKGEKQTIYEIRNGVKSSVFYNKDGNVIIPSGNATLGQCPSVEPKDCNCTNSASYVSITGTTQTFSDFCGISIEVKSGTADITMGSGSPITIGCSNGIDLPTNHCEWYTNSVTIDATNGTVNILIIE